MTSLGLVGIADKGTYNAEATYNKGQFVLYDGSTWLALKDNLNGVTPAEGENWKYLARGFAAELLSLVTAIDSQGLSGSQGGQVNAQSLIDVLADKVANQLIAKSMMSNVQVNDAEKVPTSALAYAMQQSIETLNSKTGSYTHEYENFTETVLGKYVQYSFYGRPWTFSNLPVPNGNTNLSFVVSLVGSKISVAHMNIDTDGSVSLYDQDWNKISASSDILIRGTIGYYLKIQ